MVFTILLFYKVVHFDFLTWDDPEQIFNNPNVIDDGLYVNFIGGFFSSVVKMYHPFTTFTYRIEYQLFGLNNAVFHLTNLAIHCLNIGIVFYLFRQLFTEVKPYIIGIGVLVFSIHPLQVEPISWLSARSTLLCATFYFAGLVTYIKYLKSGLRKWHLLTLFMFFISLLSKAMAISFPLALFILDFQFGQNSPLLKKTLKEYIKQKFPFLFLALIFLVIAIWIRHHGVIEAYTSKEYSILSIPAIVSHQFLLYISHLIYPFNLQSLYQDPQMINLTHWVSFVLMGLTTFFLFKKRIKYRYIVLGFCLLFIPLLPIIKIRPIGHSFIADRYFYLSFIGVGVILIRLLSKFKNYKVFILLFSLFVFGVCAKVSTNQLEIWRNEVTIWTSAIKTTEIDNPLAYEYRANAYKLRGEFSLAIEDNRKAIDLLMANNIVEQDSLKIQALFMNMIQLHLQNKDEKKALQQLQNFLMIYPQHKKAQSLLLEIQTLN
jgi:hypothetical protein